MLSGRDILCISSTNWSDIWGSRQHIMRRLAKTNRVLFVETQIGPEHLLRDRHNRQMFGRWKEGLREVEPNIFAWAPPLLWPGRYYSYALNELGQMRLLKHLRPVAARLGLDHPLLWIFQPNCFPLLGKLGEEIALYHCIDEFSGGTSGRKKRIILELERRLIVGSDLVFINNRGTFERKGRINARAHLMPSAADTEHYRRALEPGPVPEDLARLPKPVIAQVGSFTGKCDVGLIESVAKAEPGWSFAVIGEVWRDRVDISALEALPNVHFLGKKDYAVLPDYLRGADVCTIPYRVSDETASISPLKLYEYMAAGRPIVSTAIPEVVEQGDAVSIGTTPESFRAAIAGALACDRAALRAKQAPILERNNWDRRVEEMSTLIEETLVSKRMRMKRPYCP